jgi:hypothetical protein
VPSGIALSAPAILSRHEYTETLLTNEDLKKKTEPRASSTGRRGRASKSNVSISPKKLQFKSDDSRCFYEQRRPSNVLASVLHINLPEFIEFQSDHLVLTPQLAARPFHERLRGSSTFSTTKFSRPSNNNPSVSPTGSMNTMKTSNYTSAKRLSRSRYSYDTTVYQDKQQGQTNTKRSTSTKFDSVSCFKEVSRRTHFPSLPLARSLLLVSCALKQKTFVAQRGFVTRTMTTKMFRQQRGIFY